MYKANKGVVVVVVASIWRMPEIVAPRVSRFPTAGQGKRECIQRQNQA